jgi:hypothetical protein
LQRAFPYDVGTATRAYTARDFLIARSQNMINNPIGIGLVISFLVIISFMAIFITYRNMKRKKRIWLISTFLWAVFAFLGVNSVTFNLPFGLFAFRFWMLLAIPLAILAAEGMWFLLRLGKSFNIPKGFLLFVIILGVIFTSAQQKFTVNTAIWSPGQGFTSFQEVSDFSSITEFGTNTRIFGFCPGTSVKIIGFDQFDCGWCPDVLEAQEKSINTSAQVLYTWMQRKNYEYTVISSECVRTFGINATNMKLQELVSSAGFQPVKQGEAFVLLKIV